MANKKEIESPFVKAKPKVIIALAIQDTVKSLLLLSLLTALREGQKDFDYDVAVSMGCDLIGSRTRLVNMAKKMNGTHILFIDHDMVLNPSVHPITNKLENPISRALRADKDILGAPYNFRSESILPLRKSTAVPVSDLSDKTGLYQCEALGTGFMLIKMSVFDKIEKPWFQFGRNENAELVYGEDTWLTRQAIKAGLSVYADGGLKIGHLGDYQY